MPVGPGALDLHVANAAVSYLGDATASDCLAGRSYYRSKAEISHELAWALEPLYVTNLGGECHGNDQVYAPQ